MTRLTLTIALCLLAVPAAAEQLAFLPTQDPQVLGAEIPALAHAFLAQNQGTERNADPELLFRVELVSGDARTAVSQLNTLIASRSHDDSPRVRARDFEYLIYASARANGKPFHDEYAKAFHAIVTPLDNRTAAIVVSRMDAFFVSLARQSLQDDLERWKDRKGLSSAEAAKLLKDYAEFELYAATDKLAPPLVTEDDGRRYTITRDVRVTMPDGVAICALIMLPRGAGPLPTLMQFTIYNERLDGEARRTVSNEYASVTGLVRGKGCGDGPAVPYERDGADAAALIDWIAAQPWSDGRVGMYGGSYSGGSAWGAAKHHPKALKAIAVGAPVAPGLDVPMEGNVKWNFVYPFPFYATNNKTLDDATYNDNARWNRLYHDWYASGRAFRDLESIDGTPNPVFNRWVDHPEYDPYWQAMIPYKQEFATLNIAVLQLAGYYSGGPGAANYYFREYQHYSPDADNTLVIGPYDHLLAQRGTASSNGNIDEVVGYKLDPAAQIDLVELRFRWFDHIFKSAPKPPLLADRVNYEVMGANVWKHAPSLAAMASQLKKLYFGGALGDGTYRLGEAQGSAPITQTVDFADRSDADRLVPGGGFADKEIDTANSLVFVGAPYAKPTELSGLFSARLDVITNKRDFDFQVSLYDKTAAGEYIQLAQFWSRASSLSDLSRRHLLVPGKLQSLSFTSNRLLSRLFAPGSRLVIVLGVLKGSDREINYGTENAVALETIADANPPLTIKWLGSSFIAVPLGR